LFSSYLPVCLLDGSFTYNHCLLLILNSALFAYGMAIYFTCRGFLSRGVGRAMGNSWSLVPVRIQLSFLCLSIETISFIKIKLYYNLSCHAKCPHQHLPEHSTSTFNYLVIKVSTSSSTNTCHYVFIQAIHISKQHHFFVNYTSTDADAQHAHHLLTYI
jgi:hypothetical protein